MTVLFLSMFTSAQAYELTSGCAAVITAEDEDRLAIAEAFLLQRHGDVYADIARNRAGGDEHDYSSVSQSDYDSWVVELKNLAKGGVKIHCAYDGDYPCGPSTRFGMTNTFDFMESLDNVVLCMDNIRAQPVDMTGLLTGVLAHELSHHVDGLEPHGDCGKTDVNHPDTTAEVLGVASEALFMTGQLQVVVDDVKFVDLDATSMLELSWHVDNTNTNTFADAEGLADVNRNPASHACLTWNGVEYDYDTRALDGGASSRDYWNLVAVPLYEITDPIHYVGVAADCDDDVWEWKENDNAESFVISTWVDLAVDVELAEAPEFLSEYRDDVYPPGWYHWYRLSFQADVTNLDSENRSPPADFTFLYDNMWTGESFFQDNRTIPGLLPGETTPLAFVVDVPTDMVGTAPLGTTRLDFVADFHSESMHDRNRKNNVVNMEIDADWWAPDYRLEEVSFVTAVTRRKQRVEFSVKNYGPVNATSGSLATVSSATGTHSASLFPVPPLDVLETSTTYGVELSQALCQVHVHTLTADGNNAITENDETNNEVVLGLGDDCSDRELRAAFEQPHLLEEQMYPWYLDQNLVQESEAVWAQVDEWLAAMQSELPTGPFLPGADTDDWGRRELYIPLAQGMALGVAPGSTQWNTDRLWYLDSALLSAPQQPVRTRWVQDLLQPQDQ